MNSVAAFMYKYGSIRVCNTAYYHVCTFCALLI